MIQKEQEYNVSYALTTNDENFIIKFESERIEIIPEFNDTVFMSHGDFNKIVIAHEDYLRKLKGLEDV